MVVKPREVSMLRDNKETPSFPSYECKNVLKSMGIPCILNETGIEVNLTNLLLLLYKQNEKKETPSNHFHSKS